MATYIESSEPTNLVKIEMESGSTVVIKLNEQAAPITVKNFQDLVKEGFYDGLIFHRVIAGFMVQGGDPTGTGMGGSKRTIKGEFRMNGIHNPLSHKRGVISMARTNYPDSASSQFFICHADVPFLDGQYAAFGEVVQGIETVDEIASANTNSMDKPLSDQRMKRVYFVKEA